MLTPLNMGDNIGQSLAGLDVPYGDINFYTRPPQWSMDTHRHPYFQFLLVIAGEVSVTVNSDETVFERGMVSLIPPENPHRLFTKAGYRQLGINLTSLAPEDRLIKILSSHVTTPLVITAPVFLELLPEIEDCARLQTAVSIQKIRNRLEYMLLNCIETLNKQDNVLAFREKLMAYFRKNLSNSITLENISQTLFMSSSHIERLCDKEFGCGAIHLFHRLKIDRACMLLQTTNMSIADLARHLGYQDQGYFSRLFRKYTGVNPLNYHRDGKSKTNNTK